MSRRRKRPHIHLTELHKILPKTMQFPLAVIMGPPRGVAEFVKNQESEDIACFQMDLHHAYELREALAERRATARIVAGADLWDIEPSMQTIIYPVPHGGERGLKLDMVEQAYHTLCPGGVFVVLTPREKEQLFGPLLKKVFGSARTPEAGNGSVLWAKRGSDRDRRRHETSFHVQQESRSSLRFVSRPGVFSYGRFDEGARALVESFEIRPGDKVLDLGCGCGTNGIIAALRSGPDGEVVFVDSNLRALALAEINAKANGVNRFRIVPSNQMDDLGKSQFDVVLANPPYFAQHRIAQIFIERARELLRPGGRLYLVTKNPAEVAEMITEHFEDVQVDLRRGYHVFCAKVAPLAG